MAELLDGVSFLDGEPVFEYTITCPACGGERLRWLDKEQEYECLTCRMLFETEKLEDTNE